MTAPNERDKFIEAVAKLISLTQQGRLTWTPAPRVGIPEDTDERRYDSFFTTEYNNQRLRIYRTLTKVRVAATHISAFGKLNETTWSASHILQFIDYNDRMMWSFPPNPGIKDLLTTVQYQAAGVSNFLDNILREE